MRNLLAVSALALLTVVAASGQSQPTAPDQSRSAYARKHGRSAAADVGSGAGDIGKGVGKGAGNVAVGAGKGAVDLATLHPLDAAADLGKGGVSAGKDIGVGAVKGTGKIARGTGKAIRKIL